MTIDFRDIAETIPRAGHYVYELRNDDGPVYVGMSSRPRERVRAHWREAAWWPSVTAIEIHGPYDSAATAGDVERAMIRETQPPHNLEYTSRFQRKHYPPRAEPTVEDLRRELLQAQRALYAAENRLARALRDEANKPTSRVGGRAGAEAAAPHPLGAAATQTN